MNMDKERKERAREREHAQTNARKDGSMSGRKMTASDHKLQHHLRSWLFLYFSSYCCSSHYSSSYCCSFAFAPPLAHCSWHVLSRKRFVFFAFIIWCCHSSFLLSYCRCRQGMRWFVRGMWPRGIILYCFSFLFLPVVSPCWLVCVSVCSCALSCQVMRWFELCNFIRS